MTIDFECRQGGHQAFRSRESILPVEHDQAPLVTPIHSDSPIGLRGLGLREGFQYVEKLRAVDRREYELLAVAENAGLAVFSEKRPDRDSLGVSQ